MKKYNTINSQVINKTKNIFNKINNRIINENIKNNINLSNLKKLIQNNGNIKKCRTERNSLSDIHIEKFNKKIPLLKEKKLKINTHKTSNFSIENQIHNNRTLLLSNKKLTKQKTNMKYLTCIPSLKENIKINKTKFIKIIRGNIDLNFNSISNRLTNKEKYNEINDKNCKTENKGNKKGYCKRKNNYCLSIKGNKSKNFKTIINFRLAKKIINNKNNFITKK